MNQTAELVSRTEDEMNTHLNETRVQISDLEQGMADSVGRIEGLEKNQSVMKGAADKTQAQIATVEQKVAASQSNTQTLQSRVQSLGETQGDLKSKTTTIESKVDTRQRQIDWMQRQIDWVQQTVGTFAGFSAYLNTNKHYDQKTVIVFDGVIYNHDTWPRPRDYNPNTGIFTVPVSGVYVFTFNVEVNSNFVDIDIGAHVNLMLNSNIKSQAIVQGLGNHLSSGNTAVLDVQFGDKVFVSTSSHFRLHKLYAWRTTFSGALLRMN
ncbi:uncharacterized protein LOC127848894 [Dreissena polymorpha]|uniref:C1q domain-containing protein n=1 Tax=Dreissena polymorpha TaxID=45954 RepID=A0A9D4DLV8_DREPO|nr:uncharacterized protein LOC127848894 [Dreissena polymorpha]KAH3750740.1 hypothetical protein DPMN_185271 [Dreissena polymorpha]